MNIRDKMLRRMSSWIRCSITIPSMYSGATTMSSGWERRADILFPVNRYRFFLKIHTVQQQPVIHVEVRTPHNQLPFQFKLENRNRLVHFHVKAQIFGIILGAPEFITALCNLIQNLVIDHLHIVGDIYDRGPGPYVIMDTLIRYDFPSIVTVFFSKSTRFNSSLSSMLDILWYIWAGPNSPVFGKDKMATFERYFLEEKELHTEIKNSYYRLLISDS